MGQSRQLKRRRVNPDPIFPNLRPVQAVPVTPIGTVQTRSSKRRRLDSDPGPDRLFPNLPPVQGASVLPARKVQGVQQASQPRTIRSRSGKGQNRHSKRRRVNPDPIFPNLRPVAASSVPPAKTVQAVAGHVRKQQEAPLPPANSLEGLPHELQLMIYDFLPDVDTFDALVDASPVHRRLWAYNRFARIRSRLDIKSHELQYWMTVIRKKLSSME